MMHPKGKYNYYLYHKAHLSLPYNKSLPPIPFPIPPPQKKEKKRQYKPNKKPSLFCSSFSFVLEIKVMKNTIRCCISCILPCGALDVIRIVHVNGRVEEISGTIKAEEIMKLHPKHLLKKPKTSSNLCEDGIISPNIVVVPPDALLQRGKIYFLIPLPNISIPPSEKKNNNNKKKITTSRSSSTRQKKEVVTEAAGADVVDDYNNVSVSSRVVSDQYLSEILSNKASTQRDRRRGRVGIWRPHLESICETPVEAL